jgi:hypothetical protein
MAGGDQSLGHLRGQWRDAMILRQAGLGQYRGIGEIDDIVAIDLIRA